MDMSFSNDNASEHSTSPHGPTSLQAPEPAVSPDSLIGAATPIERASVAESSIWSAFLTGPRIETFASSFLRTYNCNSLLTSKLTRL